MKSKKSLTANLEEIMPVLIGAWRRMLKISGPPDVLQTREFRSVVEAVKVMQDRAVKGKSLIGTDYFANPQYLGAYLLYQWVVNYQQGLSLIGELPTPPKRVLDICSGPGAFAFAALRHGAQEVIAMDQNVAALQLGAEICGRNGYPLTIRKWNCNKESLMVEGQFDLIIVAHCLDEIFPSTKKSWEESQRLFIEKLMRRLTPNGHILIVDNSFTDANKRVLSLRDSLVQLGVPVQAPCVWRGECPALKTPNSPCYAQREFEKPYLIREIQRATSVNLSSLKMSYVIFRNPSSSWPKLGEQPLYRVISPPVDAFGGKRYYLCGTDGKKQLSSHLKEHPPESRAFEYLRRGELISFTDALIKDNAIDIVEGTIVHVNAACGKPVIEKEP